MTKEELENRKLERRAKEWLVKDKGNLIDELTKKADTNHQLVEQLAKLNERCSELEAENEQIKNSDTLCKLIGEQKIKIEELEAQIEKLIDFVLSKTECCDVCPITDTCINSEGTCPYAGILAKGEEEVTREWIMQFISKEIKEK